MRTLTIALAFLCGCASRPGADVARVRTVIEGARSATTAAAGDAKQIREINLKLSRYIAAEKAGNDAIRTRAEAIDHKASVLLEDFRNRR